MVYTIIHIIIYIMVYLHSFTVLHRQLVKPVTASAVTGKPKQPCCKFHFNAVRWTLISVSYESSTSGNPGYTGGNLVQQR